jgi:creatinine amidohydrolase
MVETRTMEIEWQNLRAPELRRLATESAIVLVPVGSMEQHGPHLPVQVDALLAGEVARRAALRIADRQPVVVAPTVWCGLAEHHMAFGATITLDFATFHALIRCVCGSIRRHGFERIALVNGHGGNIKALDVIAGELCRELEASVITATYWTLRDVASAFAGILEAQRNVRHACEAETSMLLALRPALVDWSAVERAAPIEAEFPRPDGLYRFRGFEELTEPGYIGAPSAASAAKGERLLDAAANGLAQTLLGDGVWA